MATSNNVKESANKNHGYYHFKITSRPLKVTGNVDFDGTTKQNVCSIALRNVSLNMTGFSCSCRVEAEVIGNP